MNLKVQVNETQNICTGYKVIVEPTVYVYEIFL